MTVRVINRPQPGYFAIKLVKGGPDIAALLYLPCPSCPDFESGPMDRSRHLLCEVDGDPKPDSWIDIVWTSGREISRDEFIFLRDDAKWCRAYAPHEPRANPRRSIDARRIDPVLP